VVGAILATGAHQFATPDAAADRAIRGKHFLPLFSAIFPAAPVRRLAGVGHYCFEDAPEAVAGLIAEFIRQA